MRHGGGETTAAPRARPGRLAQQLTSAASGARPEARRLLDSQERVAGTR
ncbi:hypothetical protein [Streptomyces sp. NPDC019224]